MGLQVIHDQMDTSILNSLVKSWSEDEFFVPLLTGVTGCSRYRCEDPGSLLVMLEAWQRKSSLSWTHNFLGRNTFFAVIT